MSLIGDSKEEDREIFAFMKQQARERRHSRQEDAMNYFQKARMLMDDGILKVDPNGTWNGKLKGRSLQYWPTKGRWQYTSAKLIQEAKQRAWRNKHPNEIRYYTKDTQFGGGIKKFLDWLEKQQ